MGAGRGRRSASVAHTRARARGRDRRTGTELARQARMAKNIVIAYATKEGQTQKVAEHVAARLREHGVSVTVVDVAHPPTPLALATFDAAVLAASVHVGAYEREMVRFATENNALLAKLPTTFLSVSLSAQSAHDEHLTPERRAEEETKTLACVDKFVEQTRWHPGRVELVAGALRYTQYNVLARFIMKRVAKSVGLPTDTARDYEYTDWRTLDHLADEIAGAGPS
jgi:menaquinone-dependent protoporphyrinogen oxidase